MEENNTNPQQKPNEPRTAPILDVQPPKSAETPASSDVPNAPSPSVVTPPPVEQSTEPTPVTETGAPDPIKQPEITAAHKHSTPVVPIIIALVIAAILAVVTVLAFKNTNTPVPSENLQTSTQEESTVTPESIDATSTEIDQTLGEVDENSDFPEDELSDQNLSL